MAVAPLLLDPAPALLLVKGQIVQKVRPHPEHCGWHWAVLACPRAGLGRLYLKPNPSVPFCEPQTQSALIRRERQ